MCARAQFTYANRHLHHLHDSVVKAVENVTYIEPKMKEVSARLTELLQWLFTHSNCVLYFYHSQITAATTVPVVILHVRDSVNTTQSGDVKQIKSFHTEQSFKCSFI